MNSSTCSLLPVGATTRRRVQGERGSHGVADERSEQAVQQALLDIKRKFGKNSVIKAMDMFDGATGQQRNNQIGGHAA